MSENFEQLRLFGADVVVLTQGYVNEEQLSAWGLTPRERDVVRCVCLAMNNQQIADRLGISRGHVTNRLEKIYLKANVSNRSELGMLASRPPGDEPPGLRLVV